MPNLTPVDRQLAEDLQAQAERYEATLPTEQDEQWLAPWYLERLAEIDAVEAKVKEQAAAILRECERRRQALAWRWGEDFRAEVEADLAAQKGKKKSVNYLTGRAGFRKTAGRVEIIHPGEAMAWALEHCPDALDTKVARTTPIREKIEATGEIPPGVAYTPPGERFYPDSTPPKLTAGE